MKNLIPITLAATLVASGISSAQTPAYSKPSGYVTQTLAANQFNLLGITLHNSPIASGNFEIVAGTALTDSGANFAATTGRVYILEITSGLLAGTIQEVSASNISQATITTPQNLQTMGLAVGDKFSLRLAPILEEIFGVDANSSLKRSLNFNTADLVWISNGAGSYDKYFVHTANGGEFRAAGTTTATPRVPVVYADGIFVQKRGVASTVTLTGQVKTTNTNTVVTTGFNLVSLVSPAGVTLFNSGLADDLKPSLNPLTADLVWVQQTNGLYFRYFRHPSNGGTWRDFSDPTLAISSDFNLPSMVLVQRRASNSGNITLTVPPSYSGL